MKRSLTMIYRKLRSKKAIEILKLLKNRDINNSSSNLIYQKNKLFVVLDTAFSNISFYKSMEKHCDLKNLTYSEFCKIPVLTKDIVRDSPDALINQSYKKINEVHKATSGGSTGEPLTFFRTNTQNIHGQAAYYYALELNKVDIFGKSIDLWGAERDMHSTNSSFNFKSFLNNRLTLNTFVMSDIIISRYIDQINSTKPIFIKAYVHSIYDIAKYINKNNIKIKCKPVIHCTTGPLYPEMRDEISKAFNNTYVYNFYGSREVSAIASEVRGSEGLFVFYDNIFLEILDENDNPVKKGEEGEIVITTLNNFYMPLIRYKIGDRAIKGDDLEFGTLKMDKVIGRTLGVIHKADGTKIDGQFFTTLFFSKPSIKSFQLVQKDINLLELNIVKNEPFNSDELKQVLNRIMTELPGIKVEVDFCEKINLTKTGKIMYVYSEIQTTN
ncbi:phenylacetate--CoA ligase family protein [Psychrobacter sp. FME5]|uniref:phenylacetate--CoA ligase family protein n=1 Tax=Psychrobacter sp. FME5 TaxID=2487706 RepID=UPI001787C506|nr:phenylacetate--CoA ligase family protein [Psychrobacter sp. FME5]MBE0445156.1 phenylacetate--CoA ligase family protein [Psychrobacter sp. FME5]